MGTPGGMVERDARSAVGGDISARSDAHEGRRPTAAERVAGLLLPSLADVLFGALLLGVFFGLGGRALGYDGDAAWGLRIGNAILTTGLPRTEYMLFPTRGQHIIYFEWLAQAGYALAYHLGGLSGVVALVGVLVGLLGAGIFIVLRRRGVGVSLAATLTVGGLLLTSLAWTARAQLFTLALALAWSEWLRLYWHDGRSRRLWAFPPVMILWANLHGGFITGLALLGTAVAVAWLFPNGRGKANPRHLTLALAGTLVATLYTPWGIGLPLHVLGYFQNSLIPQVTAEFQSPDFHTFLPLLFLGMLFLLAASWIWLAGRGRRIEPLAVATALVWTLLAFHTVRYIAVWAVIVVPILGESLAALGKPSPEMGAEGPALGGGGMRAPVDAIQRWVVSIGGRIGRAGDRMGTLDAQVGRGVWSALVVLFLIGVLAQPEMLRGVPVRSPDVGWDAQVFPVAAAERLHKRGLPAGNGFTTYTWGSYLDFALPEYHPFIDSRADVYPESLMRDYLTVVSLSPGWRTTLNRYRIRWALLPKDAPLAQALALLPGWRCAPGDAVGVAVLCARQ